MGSVAGCFGMGTCITCRDIAVDEAAETWPIKVARHHLKRLGLSKVSSKSRIVALSENLELDRIIIRDVDEVVKEY